MKKNDVLQYSVGTLVYHQFLEGTYYSVRNTRATTLRINVSLYSGSSAQDDGKVLVNQELQLGTSIMELPHYFLFSESSHDLKHEP